MKRQTSQKKKDGDQQKSSVASHQRGGAANRTGTSRNDSRGSSSNRGKKPSAAPPISVTPTKRLEPNTSASGQSSGSVKVEEHVTRDEEAHHTTQNANLEWEKEKAELKKDKADLKNENDDLQRRLEKEKNKTKEAESEYHKLLEKVKELEQSLSKEKEGKKTLQNKYNQLEQDVKREYAESNTEWENDYKKLNKKHAKETDQLLKAIKSLTEDKDKLLARLSSLASDRLMHDNVNIADLSDADRPTKLQEVYSELYDNEWTDAFEELTRDGNATENDAIMILLKILMSSFHNCREITWGRYERLKHVASYIEQDVSLQSPKVMSKASEPVLTTQVAVTCKAQLEENDERVDQIALEDITVSCHSSATGQSKDRCDKDEETKRREESVQSADPSVSEAPKEDKSENNDGKKDEKDNLETSDQNLSKASPKDQSENTNGKKHGEESVQSADPNESETSKDKTKKKKRKKPAKESVQSCDPDMREASKDKFDNPTGKKDEKDKVVSSDPNGSESSSNDKSDNHNGKKDEKANVESSDPNGSDSSSKDESDNNNGKKRGKESVHSCDPDMREASKDKFDNPIGKDEKANVESSDPNGIESSSKAESDNNNGKNVAAENTLPGDPYNSGEGNVDSGDKDVIGASKDKSKYHLKCKIDLNFELTLAIKGIWRQTTLELKGIAAEQLCPLIETCLDMPFCILPKTSKYLKRCIDLCLKMGIQENPLHLDGFAEMDSYVGKKFEKDKFRCYTRSGSHIDFVVWPTLYMYEGGPILIKGIAQCCKPDEATDEKPS